MEEWVVVFISDLDEVIKKKLQRRDEMSEEERLNFYQNILHFKL
jgi:hypothetical protein